jgi:hypothetical protein
MQIKWKKVSDYCIKSHSVTVTRAISENKTKFIVWHNSKLVKIYDNAEIAKQEAVALIKRESACSDRNIKELLGTG